MIARIVLSIKDADYELAECSINVSVADVTTLTDLIEDYAHVFSDLILNFLTGCYAGVKVVLEPDTSSWVGFESPGTDSDIQEKVVLKVRSAITGASPFQMTIPTIFEGYLTDNGAGKVLDVTYSDVLALYALLTEDISSGGLDCVDSHGTDLVQVISAKQKFG